MLRSKLLKREETDLIFTTLANYYEELGGKEEIKL